jgi:hypothetical protein
MGTTNSVKVLVGVASAGIELKEGAAASELYEKIDNISESSNLEGFQVLLLGV